MHSFTCIWYNRRDNTSMKHLFKKLVNICFLSHFFTTGIYGFHSEIFHIIDDFFHLDPRR